MYQVKGLVPKAGKFTNHIRAQHEADGQGKGAPDPGKGWNPSRDPR